MRSGQAIGSTYQQNRVDAIYKTPKALTQQEPFNFSTEPRFLIIRWNFRFILLLQYPDLDAASDPERFLFREDNRQVYRATR